jgi:hypothetical protein
VSGDRRNRIVWDLSRLAFYPPVDGAKRAATSKTCFSQLNEWDPMNVILTGSMDGVVRMWSLYYVYRYEISVIFPGISLLTD